MTTLNPAAVDALLTVPSAEPVLFQLWFRPGKGRWHKCGRYSTRTEAMNAIATPGDWRIEELRPVAVSDGLFATERMDATPEPQTAVPLQSRNGEDDRPT